MLLLLFAPIQHPVWANNRTMALCIGQSIHNGPTIWVLFETGPFIVGKLSSNIDFEKKADSTSDFYK